LYLFIERNYTGKQIQQLHTQMAKNKKNWPSIILPADRGNIHVADVLAAPPGAARDAMIRTWCASVWTAYQNNRETIVKLQNL
jgi:ABC-type protease/lipase transport system fused ATPase/permease subunit